MDQVIHREAPISLHLQESEPSSVGPRGGRLLPQGQVQGRTRVLRVQVGEHAKKGLSLMAVSQSPPPHPSCLMAVGTLTVEKKRSIKVLFYLMVPTHPHSC